MIYLNLDLDMGSSLQLDHLVITSKNDNDMVLTPELSELINMNKVKLRYDLKKGTVLSFFHLIVVYS